MADISKEYTTKEPVGVFVSRCLTVLDGPLLSSILNSYPDWINGNMPHAESVAPDQTTDQSAFLFDSFQYVWLAKSELETVNGF